MPHSLSRDLCRPSCNDKFDVDGEPYQLGAYLGEGAAGIVYKVTFPPETGPVESC